MNKNYFPWQDISWQHFQEICLFLVETDYPRLNMTEYLKSGSKQDGIDIYDFDDDAGKYVCVQCKKYEKLNLSKLKTTIGEFKKGQFLDKTSHFIIATNADLQKRTLTDYMDSQVEEFRMKHQIKLEWWDVYTIEKKLKDNYRLVLNYFSVAIADQNCFLENINTLESTYPEVPNFIDRKVLKIDRNSDANNPNRYEGFEDYKDLKEVLLSNFLEPKKICILADAYQGKTTLIEQLAFILSKKELLYQPILIKIKTHSITPIVDRLNESYPYWKQCDFRKLVIILDGLDEVPKTAFNEYAKYINEFSSKYPTLNIIFTCRTLFYNHYNIENTFNNFDFYELAPLLYTQIESYLANILKNKKGRFDQYITDVHLNNLLYHPFYLNNLCKLFEKTQSNQIIDLPKNKKEIIEYLIDQSFKDSGGRLLSDGNKLKREEVKYKICLKRIALSIQITRSNVISDIKIQALFNAYERELLTQSSVLTFNKDSWSFNNSFFQESLSTFALMSLSSQKIIELITVGKKYRKIKTQWIQTIASFISLSDISDTKRLEIIKIIENDNIELLTLCDMSKFEPQDRIEIVKKIVNKCKEKNIFPSTIPVDTIARFIKDKKDGLELFIVLLDSQPTQLIKALCLRVIYNFNELFSLKSELKRIILKEISDASESDYAALLVNLIRKFRLADDEVINGITTDERFIKSYYYRNSVYELIIDYNLVDKYHFLGLEGIQLYASIQRNNLPLFAEKTLEKFLIQTNNVNNLKALFTTIASQEWDIFYNNFYTRNDKAPLLKALSDKAIAAHINDPSIFLPISKLVEKQILNHSDDTDKEKLINFFDKTGTNALLFKFCFCQFPKLDLWCLSKIITEDCFEYILYEYEENVLNEDDLFQLYSGIKYWGNDQNLSEKFSIACLHVTGLDFPNSSLSERQKEYQKYEIITSKNDLMYFQSPDAFIKGLKLFFKAYGQEKIPKKAIFVRESDSLTRKMADSKFISRFLLKHQSDSGQAVLSESISSVNNTDWFYYYRALELLHYHFPNQESREILLPILEKYFHEEIEKTDFTNSITQNRNQYKQKLLADIFEKYAFNLAPEFLVKLVWQITVGFNHLKKSHFDLNRKKNIGSLIIENVNKELLAETVLMNIRHGIVSNMVLSSHFEICRHLKIYEAAELVLEHLNRFRDYEQSYLIDIYVELDGEVTKLFDLFKSTSPQSNLYFDLVKAFKNNYKEEISQSLLNLLGNTEVNDENQLEAAKYLSEMGNITGFSFLLNNFKSKNITYTFSMQALSFDRIDTQLALQEFPNTIKHILDDNINSFDIHSYSIKNFLLDSLFKLAGKGENDLAMVEEFLIQSETALRAEYSNSKDIFHYIERMIEKTREADNSSYQISEIKEILEQVKF